MRILLDKNKNYYKANLHTHTNMSDGGKRLEETKEHYKKNGYSVVAFTDHEHVLDNSYLNDENFLTITSCEVAIKQFAKESTLKKMDMKVTHLNFYALDPHNTETPCYSSVADHFINDNCRDRIAYPEKDYERIYSAEGINEMIRVAGEKGFIVSYNHPGWSLETACDYLNYDGLFSVEIVNYACVHDGIPDDEVVFDHMLRAGKKIYCTACDDCHNRAPFDSVYSDACGAWIQINAEKLDYDTIMTALKNGDFYASTGPEIYYLTVDGNKAVIECSDVVKISLVTGTRRVHTIHAERGEAITKAEFEIRDTDNYCRIRIEDKNGKKAYTQSFFKEQE